jgi:hypothetical protein
MVCKIVLRLKAHSSSVRPTFTMSAFLSLLITVFIALFLRKYVMSRKQSRLYPPGPKPKPIIGNALELPSKDVPNVYIEWGKKYNSESDDLFYPFADICAIGSLIHVTALGSHVVVMNKIEDAVELFEKRAAKYSDRPEYPVIKL